MASSGWIRVAAGVRLVASAAARDAAREAGSVASRTAQHGIDLAVNLKSVSVLQRQPPLNGEVNGAASDTVTTKKSTATASTSTTTTRTEDDDDMTALLFHADRAKREQQKVSSPTTPLEEPVNILSTAPQQQQQQQQQQKEDIITRDNQQPPPSQPPPSTPYRQLPEGKAVPSTRIGRAIGFASLGVGLALGAMGEGLQRLTGTGSSSGSTSTNLMVNDRNADRLAASLCRMRGAALKLGQMLSIQDETLLPPELTRALKQVRQGADAMPQHQLEQQLQTQFGGAGKGGDSSSSSTSWKDRFVSFDPLPFAAASVGQCHRARVRLSDGTLQEVVVKVQYPGVGQSIESDLQNLAMLVQWTGMAPKGLFLDNVIRVGKEELKVECDYERELQQQQRMKELVEADPVLQENKFVVPRVFPEFSTSQVLTTAFAPGGTVDKVAHLDQEERNRIARTILYLTIQELFVWRFMQTDPNWGNFLYDVGTQTTSLIDFGATREYSKEFVDGYLRIVWASSNQDEERLMAQSYKMGFLTGEENDIMLHAHKQSGYTVGEPFQTNEPFDFRESQLSTRMGQHTSVFLKHRLTPPPSEVYTLHRKLAGAFMLCIKLGAVIRCRDLLENVLVKHVFEDGQEPPPLRYD